MDNQSQLLTALADRSLERLESEVWRQVSERLHARAAARWRISVQALIMIMALIVSVGFGIKATHDLTSSSGSEELSPALNAAPSSLLLSQTR